MVDVYNEFCCICADSIWGVCDDVVLLRSGNDAETPDAATYGERAEDEADGVDVLGDGDDVCEDGGKTGVWYVGLIGGCGCGYGYGYEGASVDGS